MQVIKLLVLTAVILPWNAQSVSLTWEEVLKFTIEGNPALEASRREWLGARQTENSVEGRYLPSLSASTSVTRTGAASSGGGFVTNGVVVNSGGQINTNYLASLNLTQNLFNGLEDKSRIEQASWNSKNKYWSYLSTKASVSLSLKNSFANLVYAQELVALSRSILDRRESNHKLVLVRYQNGRENKGSVLLAEAYLEQARLDLIKAQDELNVAQVSLKSLMNKDHLETISVTGAIPLEKLSPDRNDFELLAVETPAYNQAHAAQMMAQEDIKISRSAFLPDLNFNGQVTRQGDTYFPERERWSLALTLTIPLFDGLRDLGTYKASVENSYAFEAKKRSTLLDLIPQMRNILNEAKQSDIKFSIDQKFQTAASTRAEIARKKYNNGLLTFEDWDIIESELINRQMNFLQSKRERVIKYATWENILGKGSIL